MKFQDKFYDLIVHNKCPSSEKDDEKCILRKSDFHQILPNYDTVVVKEANHDREVVQVTENVNCNINSKV